MRRRTISFLTLALAAAFWLPAATRVDGQAQQPRVIALRGGTVHTITKGTLPNATVLIRDGKIAAVGANVTVPADAQVVDAAGKHITDDGVTGGAHASADAVQQSRPYGQDVSTRRDGRTISDSPAHEASRRALAGRTR